MGDGGVINCGSCGWTLQVMIGVGMADNGIQTVLREMRPDVRSEVEAILDKEVLTGDRFWRDVFACPQCHSISQELYVRIEYGKGNVYEPEYACTSCGKASLQRLDLKKLKHKRCPQCGEKQLSCRFEMLWD